MDERKADSLTVTLNIDAEQLPALQGALAFLADICSTYGLVRDGSVREDCEQNKHYGEALGYILFLASQIGEAALDNA